MQTISYKRLLEAAVSVAGIPPQQVTQLIRSEWQDWLQLAIEWCWNAYGWPDLMRIEKHYYRPVWAVGSYPAEAEIYHAPSDNYYKAVIETSAEPGSSDDWMLLSGTNWSRYIPISQIHGTVYDVYHVDPYSHPYAADCPSKLMPYGLAVLPTAGNCVWLRILPDCPQWIGDDWNSDMQAVAGENYYYNGDYYWAKNNTSSAPADSANWELIRPPHMFKLPVCILTNGFRLDADEQAANAQVQIARGERRIDDLCRRYAHSQLQRTRTQFRTARPQSR